MLLQLIFRLKIVLVSMYTYLVSCTKKKNVPCKLIKPIQYVNSLIYIDCVGLAK